MWAREMTKFKSVFGYISIYFVKQKIKESENIFLKKLFQQLIGLTKTENLVPFKNIFLHN